MKRSPLFFLRIGAPHAALAAALVAATTLVSAQTPAPPHADPSAPTTNNGWKRVGENAQVQNPDQAPPPAPADSNDGQDPAAQNAPPYPQQNDPQQNYPQQNYPQQRQQPPLPQQRQQQQQRNYPPPPPVPASLTLQRGVYLTVRINQQLSSDKNQPGDAFTTALLQPVVVDGVVVAEPGQTIGGRVATAEHHHTDSPGRLGLQLTNLTLVDGQNIPLNTQFISRQAAVTSKGTEFGTVAATTGIGAAIGAAAGWGTGAAIGAGAGAAAGLIGVMITHNHASVVYPEEILTFRVESPATISTVNSTQAFRYVEPNEYDRPTYTNYGNNGPYQSASPAPPPVYNYAYGYPYYGAYGWGYPYYWGPSFAFYGGYWGRPYYGGFYGRGYYGGYRGYGGGYHGGYGGGYRGGRR